MKFGTCGESRNTYDDQVAGNDFMGPALWSADPAIYAVSNPEAVDFVGFDLGSHLDMMHETPLCMGIAWVSDNIYFVFEGLTGTIARYDFKSDHGPGFDDHSDGTVERFVDVDVARIADVPSHMVYDRDSELLYVADTGNNRVSVLDTSTALQVSEFRGTETMVQESTGATWTEFVVGEDAEFQAPSGLALHNGVLYVGDNLTSRVSAFDLEGNLLDTLDLDIAEGGLMGLRVSPDGESLYVTDFIGNRVLRVARTAPSPSPAPGLGVTP
jgi:sugar lactone lactonase YvrE